MKKKLHLLFRKHIVRITIWSLSAMMIGTSVLCEYRSKVEQSTFDSDYIIKRLEQSYQSTQRVANQWLSATDTALLARLWKTQPETPLDNNQTALYLLRGDSVVYWNNSHCTATVTSLLKTTNKSIVEIEGAQALIINNHNSFGNSASVVITLRHPNIVNHNLFSGMNLTFRSTYTGFDPSKDAQTWTLINFRDTSFWVSQYITPSPIMALDIVGWLGLLLFLVIFISTIRRATTRQNVTQAWLAVIFTLGALRITMLLIPLNLTCGIDMTSYFSGWQQMAFSPFNLLVNAVFILCASTYQYSVRHKFEWRLQRTSKIGQILIQAVMIVLRCIALVYFHWAIIENIYNNEINADLFNIFSTNAPGILLYFSAGIYFCARLLQTKLNKSTVSNHRYQIVMISGMAVLLILTYIVRDQLHGTGWLLLLYSLAFRSLGIWWRRFQPSTLFAASVAITALYFATLIIWESRAANMKTAREYTILLSQPQINQSKAESIRYQNYSYAILDRYKLSIKSNNHTDLQNILPYTGKDTIIKIGTYTHIVHPLSSQRTLIVTNQLPGILDWMAMVCYIFLILTFISLTIMYLLGINIAKGRLTPRSMAFKIQTLIMGMVLFIMMAVTVVCINYSFQNAIYSQKQIVNNNLQTLLSSMNTYIAENPNSPTILRDWYNKTGKTLGQRVVLYNNDGKKTDSVITSNSSWQFMNSIALANLKWNHQPFYTHRDNDATNPLMTVYLPAFNKETSIGYMGIVFDDPTEKSAIYPALANMFNLFVIILVITLWLSIALNIIITRPLETLRSAMATVGLMRKIPMEHHIQMDVEIRKLVAQYNQMIDYLEESHAVMVKYEREGAWQEMARRMAHEIKNPLTPMRLKVQMLQRFRKEGADDLDRKTEATLNLLLEQIDVITEVIDDFRDFSSMRESNHLSILNLCTVVGDTAALYDKYENVKVIFDNVCCEPVWVYADGNQISRVLGNLCKNAIESVGKLPDGVVSVSLTKRDTTAVITVEDNGPGIPNDIVDKIFIPNFTTKTNGSGLGLIISQQIIQDLGGNLTFNSSIQKGTQFKVELPLKS